MRLIIVLTCVVMLALLGSADLPKGDEPLEGRQELFTTIADGAVTGDDLLALQVEQLISELHYIQLEVERYRIDESVSCDLEGYRNPQSVNQLVVETYSEYWDAMMAYARPGFYPNPFTASGADDLNAVCVPFGWTEDAVGNFSYLTILDKWGNAVSYMLVGYGATRESGIDIDGDGQPDGVVIALDPDAQFSQDSKVFYDNGRVVVDGRVVGEADGAQQESDLASDSPELRKAKEAKIKQGLHGVQLAVERHGVDVGHYPQSIDLTVFPAHENYAGRETPYLADGWFYTNPLADNHAGEVSARCIPYGWTPDAPGNFSYLTRYDEVGNVKDYLLVGYGAVKEDGMDINGDGAGDGVIIFLWQGIGVESGTYEYYNCGRIVELVYERTVRGQH